MQSLAEGANALQIFSRPWGFMAARPRWLADVLEGADGDDDVTRRADRWPVGAGDEGALGSPSAEDATVEVPVVELPEDRAAQAFGRRLASEASGPASALGDSEPEEVQGHATEAAGASTSQADAAAVAGGGLTLSSCRDAAGAMENVAELPVTPPAAFGELPASPSAKSLPSHIRALERELDGVHLDAARDRRAHRRLETTVGTLLSELHAARSDVAQLLQRVARLEPAPDGVVTPERSRSPPRH